MSTGESIMVERQGPVCTITLNRDRGMNLLGTESLQMLSHTFATAAEDRQVRAVVITGRGNFSAGADIREMKDMSVEQAGAFARLGQGVFNMIERMDKAVIAAVTGYALGGGCELALACDIRICDESARFGQIELSLGLIPGFGGTQRLARIVGHGRAMEMMLTGRMVGAQEAGSIGLVGTVVPLGDALKAAMEIAQTIAGKSPVGVAMVKRIARESSPLEKGLAIEAESFMKCFGYEDHREGIRAFLEKRPPVFRGE